MPLNTYIKKELKINYLKPFKYKYIIYINLKSLLKIK